MPKKSKSVAIRVKKLRTARKLKAYELARMVGVSPMYITQIEKHGKLPSLKVMRRIAEELYDKSLLKLYVEEKYPEVKEVLGEVEEWEAGIVQDLP